MTQPVICVDFDGVIASWYQGTFYRPGPPIRGAAEFLESLSKIGRVIIHTCRTTQSLYDDQPVSDMVDAIWDWLANHGMRDCVSEVYAGQGKPFASCYIDDKAVPCTPETHSEAYRSALHETVRLCSDTRKAHVNKVEP